MSGSIDEYRLDDVTKDTLYVMRDGRKTIDAPECENDGTDIELGD